MRTIPEREQRLILFFLAVFVMGSAVLLLSRDYLDRVPLTASRETPAPPRPEEAANRSDPAGPLNPNYATEEELRTLPGIGEELARRIVSHRRDHIYFSPVDLLEVPGIGVGTVEHLKPLLEFDAPVDASRGE